MGCGRADRRATDSVLMFALVFPKKQTQVALELLTGWAGGEGLRCAVPTIMGSGAQRRPCRFLYGSSQGGAVTSPWSTDDMADLVAGAHVTVDDLALKNAGWKWQALNPNKPMTEEQAIRCACAAVWAGWQQHCSVSFGSFALVAALLQQVTMAIAERLS